MLICFVLVVRAHPSFIVEIEFVKVWKSSICGVLSLVEPTSMIS